MKRIDSKVPSFSLTITPDLISWVECEFKTQHGGFRYTRLNGDKTREYTIHLPHVCYSC